MHYLLVIFMLVTPCFAQAAVLKKLPEKYQVAYGDPNAPIKIVEYFSFQCPHCLSLFRSDFKVIEEAYIDTKKVYWVFHPIPADLVTVQGMVCMENLNGKQKKLFLETLLEGAEASSPQITALIMSKTMEIFALPIPGLQNEDYLQKTNAFFDAFNFLTQEEKVLAVPTIEVDLKLFPKEVPDFDFVQSVVKL